MSYSTKFASALYGPFREAADSGFLFRGPDTYQMDPANAREAFLESQLDAREGADILMVKPAGNYLDVLSAVCTIGLPVAAYQVSGEYSQIKAAAERGWIDEKAVALETLTCIKRAGADLIITYFAMDAAALALRYRKDTPVKNDAECIAVIMRTSRIKQLTMEEQYEEQ